MSSTTASGFRTMTKTVVAGAFIAVTAIGVAVPANAQPDLPTGPDDPRCLQYPLRFCDLSAVSEEVLTARSPVDGLRRVRRRGRRGARDLRR
jgi:hypothetical protein